jgi:hypothetical protein
MEVSRAIFAQINAWRMERRSQKHMELQNGKWLSRPFHTASSEEAQQNPALQPSLQHYLREVLEALLAPSIVSVIGILFPSIWLQSHLIFCVFFLIVFVIALHYHVVTTYIVGFLVAGGYSLLLWYQANPSFSLLQIFLEPFLLFVSSIVMSEMLRTRQQQIGVVEQQHVQQKDFLEEMKQRYQAIQVLNAELEQQLVGQAVSVSTVNEKMVRLWELQGQEQYNAILDLVMHTLNAKFCAIYMLRNGCMIFCANQKRDNSKYTYPVRLTLDVKDALISRTIQSRQVCTIHDVLADSRPTQQVVAIMAGPLVDHRNEIMGIVIVDDMPLLKFLPTTVRLFGSLLQMISINLAKINNPQ